ncbi:MAG: hypothetical protein WBP16_15560 [Ferruginibacter sp.]
MEHLYTVHTKIIEGKTYYFVKKLLAFNEFKGLAEVVIGYGMHIDFDKACSIAGIQDAAIRQSLLLDLEECNKLQEPVVPVNNTIQITDFVNRWIAEQGVGVLN